MCVVRVYHLNPCIYSLVYQPDDYIAVFSLRNWAKMRNGILTTEIVSARVLDFGLPNRATGVCPCQGI